MIKWKGLMVRTPMLGEVRGKRNAAYVYADELVLLHDLPKRTTEEQIVYTALMASLAVITPDSINRSLDLIRSRE
jgi:hypothetical protein